MKKVLLFLLMFLVFNISVKASEYLDLIPISGVYSSQLNMDNGAYFSSNQKKYYMNEKIVYCVEPGVGIYTRNYDGSYDLSSSGFNEELINKINLIGHFGYDYPGHETDNYFLAAQELIWELIGNNEVHFTTGINDTGDMINIDFEKNEIMSLVNYYYIKPSFDSSFISGVYDDEIVLVDTNNVLSNYEVTSSNNSVYIDGNSLVVKFSSLGSDNIVLTRKKYDDGVSVYYHADGSQDFMFLRSSDSVISTLSVDTYLSRSNIHIDKRGLMLDDISESNDFIYNERGLTGVYFELYASNDIYDMDCLVYSKDELVEKLITIDGEAISRDLPNGNYYLKEIETIDGFILDSNVINIELSNDRKEVYTYMVNLKNERQKIFIDLHKHGEFFDGVVDDSGNYVSVTLSGVTFGLYSSSDIYDADGHLLIEKDILIKEFVTDQNGVISEELNIPFGTYYLKELKTLEGYKLDTNIYEFSVFSDVDDNIKIMVTKEPIVNEMIKSKLVINKIDSYGNKLSGAYFKLFDDFNNLIYEGYTDSDGTITISNLGYGKYHFYEVIAPDGYYLNNRVYDIDVISDNDLIRVDVLNQEMPATFDIYGMPKKLSLIGLGFGLLTLSLAVIYDKKFKDI